MRWLLDNPPFLWSRVNFNGWICYGRNAANYCLDITIECHTPTRSWSKRINSNDHEAVRLAVILCGHYSMRGGRLQGV